MILLKTLAPSIISDTSLQNKEYTISNTSMCSTVHSLSSEYAVSFDIKDIVNSPDPFKAARQAANTIILAGPALEPHVLQHAVDKINTLPPAIRARLQKELNDDFKSAYELGCNAMGDGFVSILARSLCGCSSPCNYFKPVGDSVGILARTSQSNTYNTSPPWDNSSLTFAPTNIAAGSYNKVSPNAQNIIVSAAIQVKDVFAKTFKPLTSLLRRSTETALMRSSQGIGATSNGYYYVTDPYPYFVTQQNASNILARANSSLRDCFRLHEYKHRINPNNPQMNMSVASNMEYNMRVEGATARIDVFGKVVLPNTKPSFYSIKESLDYKTSDTTWDDTENWNTNPAAGSDDESPSTTPQQMPEINMTGSIIGSYGDPNDINTSSKTRASQGANNIGTPTPPPNLTGPNYLLANTSASVSEDVSSTLMANGIEVGDWIEITTIDNTSRTLRWDDIHSGSGSVNIYLPSEYITPYIESAVKVSMPVNFDPPPRMTFAELL